jgi:hypothetical protein
MQEEETGMKNGRWRKRKRWSRKEKISEKGREGRRENAVGRRKAEEE